MLSNNMNFNPFGNEMVGEGGGGGGGGGSFPLMRQSSVYSLTLDEFQSSLGKDFGSVNMDELLKSIWSAEETQNPASSTAAAAAASGGSGGNYQGSITLPRTLTVKTVEEVWREMNTETIPHAQRQPTLGEMTLEEFLVRAGVVREDNQLDGKPNPGGFWGDLGPPNANAANNDSGFGFTFQHPRDAQLTLQPTNLPLNVNGVRCSQPQSIAPQLPQPQPHQLFEHIYDETDAADGYVSVEVSPRLADDTLGTVEAAKWLHKAIDRRNVYIKIPATAPCIPSIKETIANAISVNVTLIFSISRYEDVIDAYLDGLEASGLDDLSKITSVASFFVSRVDTLIDKMLEKIGTPEALNLRGKAAVAQAALAYQLYLKKFSGPRWEALVRKGAKKQRLLWASTSVKNPAYPDTLYVDPLIGPDTVSTMPDNAVEAFIDHGTVSRTIDQNVSEAEGVYSALGKLGISWEDVGAQLEAEGVDSFKKSFDSLLGTLKEKADSLKLV